MTKRTVLILTTAIVAGSSALARMIPSAQAPEAARGGTGPVVISKDPYAPDPGIVVDGRELAKWNAKVAKELNKIPGKDFQWPAMQPRPGVVKLFENDKFAVYDDHMSNDGSWHRHIRQALTIGLLPGRVSVMWPDGRVRTNEAATTRGPLPQVGLVSVGGDQTYIGHSEWAPDAARRRRVLYIEFKGTEIEGCEKWAPLCQPSAAASSVQGQGSRRDGKWEMTTEVAAAQPTRMGNEIGTALRPFTLTQCITQNMATDKTAFTPAGTGIRLSPSCKVDYTIAGSKEHWSATCTGDNAVTSTGDFTYSGDSYAGVVTMTAPSHTTAMDGSGTMRTVPVTMKYSARRVGDCLK